MHGQRLQINQLSSIYAPRPRLHKSRKQIKDNMEKVSLGCIDTADKTLAYGLNW